jgi:hypothetical protein
VEREDGLVWSELDFEDRALQVQEDLGRTGAVCGLLSQVVVPRTAEAVRVEEDAAAVR